MVLKQAELMYQFRPISFFKEVASGFHQISVSILRKDFENTHQFNWQNSQMSELQKFDKPNI